MTFAELGLSPKLLDAINDAGYTEPTPIQAGAIPPALAGRDVLGIAQTGTGKTASFTLPLIERLSRGRARARMPRSLIIAPTRELAAQVAENFETYSKGQKLTMALLIGGVAFKPQEEILNRGADVLIATPGRLLDHFERGKILMTGVQFLIVDEADRMLDMGFIPDLERIFNMVPPRRQVLFFSATMPKEIKSLVDRFLTDPVRVEVARPATTGANIKQYLVHLKTNTAKDKRAALRAAMNRDGVKNGIIFSNRKRDVDLVARSLQRHGFSAAPIHGDLDQSARTKTLNDFKSDTLRFLVASDVAARGLDIPDVSHVFNYDVPHHADDYVHRIGRTGRAGKSGEAVTFVTPGDDKSLAAVLSLIKQDVEELKLDGLSGDSGGKAETSDSAASKPRKRPARGGRKVAADSSEQDGAPKSAPAKAETPAEAPSAADKPTSDKPKAEKPKSDRNRKPRDPGHTPSQAAESAKPARSDNRRGRDGQQVVGFGDHVPDFMQSS
ncbi:DEAD/DEAH box helicase [Maricaulis sp. CAU 1757]